MTDLSKTEQRTPTRSAPLSRRTNILPERRNQQPVRTENFGTLRSARRGDVGGAQELLRISQQVLGAGSDFQDYANRKWQDREERQAQAGAVDAASGTVDEANENVSYNRAVDMGNAQQVFAGVLSETEGAVAEAVANSRGLKLEDRQALLVETVEATFANRITDGEGNVLDFGSAEATLYVANKLTATRTQVLEAGLRQMRAQMDRESVENAANAAAQAVMDGTAITSELINAHLTPTADRDGIKRAVFANLSRFTEADPERAVPALQSLAEEIGEGAAGDFFTSSDELSVLALLSQAEDVRERERDRARDKRHEAGAEEMFRLMGEGQLTVSYINDAAAAGQVPQRFAQQMRRSLETERRQRESDARARRAEARAVRAERRAVMEARRDRELAWELVRIRSGLGATDLAGVGAVAGSYDDRQMPLKPNQIGQVFNAMKEGQSVRRRGPEYVGFAAQISEDYDGSGVNASLQSADQRSKEARALSLFDRKVMEGMEPAQAYNQAMQEMSRTPRGDSLSSMSDEDLEAEIERLQP